MGIERETDGTRALSLEAEAAWSYWSLWDPVVEPTARPSHKQDEEATLAGRRVAHKLRASDRKALRNWYAENLQPRLSRMHPTEVAVGTAMGRSYAYYVVAGTRIPHPRHFPSLAGLVGVELPKEFAAALCSREG